MATTRAKESSVVGKEKKAPSSNSHITSTKGITKPSTTTNPINKASSASPSEKSIPNYLKPTLSSRPGSQNFKQPKTSSDAPSRPIPNRRRSLDYKPQQPLKSPQQKQPSPSRLHKALVSPGPRQRPLSLRPSSNAPVKITTTPSKPISARTSKTPREGKTQPLLSPSHAKSAKKCNPRVSTSTTKKVANDDASAANSTNNSANSAAPETTEASNVETEEVKEVTSQEVEEEEEAMKAENEEHEVENVSEVSLSPLVDSENEHEHDHGLVESDDQPHVVQDDEEKVIATVAEEEEAKEEPKEEKTEDDEHEEVKNTDEDESNNNNGTHPPEESSAAEEQVEVKENENEDELLGGVITEDYNKIKNNNEEEAVIDEKEAFEGGIVSEGGVEKEAKDESTTPPPPPKQQGKKESPVYNEVIEKTASKLLEGRKNKVRALAGAFQSVIDYQTK